MKKTADTIIVGTLITNSSTFTSFIRAERQEIAMDKQVKEALSKLNKLREEWQEGLSDLTDEDLDITADDGYWTIRKK